MIRPVASQFVSRFGSILQKNVDNMYKKCCTVLKPEITPSATQLFLFAFSNAHVFSGDLFTLVPSRDFATSLDFANEPTLLYRPLDRLTN